MSRGQTVQFTLSCNPSRSLTGDEFEEMKGSNVHAHMMRNRLVIPWPKTENRNKGVEFESGTAHAMFTFVEQAVADNTRDLYCVTRTDDGIVVYLLNRSDSAAVRMAVHGRTFDQEDYDRYRRSPYDDYSGSGYYADPYRRRRYL